MLPKVKRIEYWSRHNGVHHRTTLNALIRGIKIDNRHKGESSAVFLSVAQGSKVTITKKKKKSVVVAGKKKDKIAQINAEVFSL